MSDVGTWREGPSQSEQGERIDTIWADEGGKTLRVTRTRQGARFEVVDTTGQVWTAINLAQYRLRRVQAILDAEPPPAQEPAT